MHSIISTQGLDYPNEKNIFLSLSLSLSKEILILYTRVSSFRPSIGPSVGNNFDLVRLWDIPWRSEVLVLFCLRQQIRWVRYLKTIPSDSTHYVYGLNPDILSKSYYLKSNTFPKQYSLGKPFIGIYDLR